MKHIHHIAHCALGLLALTSCISSQSYVDPQFRQASIEELTRPASPHRVALAVEFQRNGAPLPAADGELRSAVVAALEKTGLATVVSSGEELTLHMVGNNIADMAAATRRGFATGLTLGLAGTNVVDLYEFNLSITGGGHDTQRAYKHAIHTRVGAGPAPVSGVEPSANGRAFPQVVEDIVVNFLRDLQAAKQLTLRRHHTRPIA
ncbi:MAG TPA: hypothetical protein QF730_01900 [Planctomycetota bacterium]|jgi:hypothetical protein|nr:hypothetical protein [Planctomycetota bacterium]